MNIYSYIMNPDDINYIAKTTSAFRLLSDPTRFRILCVLSKEKNGMCVYELAEAVGISQSAASHQLSKLEAREIVKCYREGQSICYELHISEFTKNLLRVMRSFEPFKKNREVSIK